MRLYDWQKQKGLSATQLAEKCGVHFTTVYGWYRGKRFPNREMALFIHKKLTKGAVSFEEATFPATK